MQQIKRTTLLKTVIPILLAASVLFCRVPVHAAQPDKDAEIVPIQTEIIQSDGERLIQRIYEVPQGTLPEDFVKDRFIKDGVEYTLRNIEKRDLPPNTEQKKVAQKLSAVSKSDDPETIQSLFESLIPYEEDGFEGELSLDAGNIQIEPGESESYSYPVRSDILTPGLPRNDPALIPKTTTKDGVQLHLVNVEWGRDDSGIQAYARYEGYASGTRVREYTATATYSGTVSREGERLSRYVAAYGPVEPDTSAPVVSASSQQPIKQNPPPKTTPKEDNGSLSIVLIGMLVVVAVGGGIAGLLFYFKRKKRRAKPKIYMPRSMAPDKEELFDEQK